jgi:hypothetical protein
VFLFFFTFNLTDHVLLVTDGVNLDHWWNVTESAKPNY